MRPQGLLFVTIPLSPRSYSGLQRMAPRMNSREGCCNGSGSHGKSTADQLRQLTLNGNSCEKDQDIDSKPRPFSSETNSTGAGGGDTAGSLGVGRLENETGTFGPTGIYGGWVRRSPMLDMFRQTLKFSRLQRIETVLSKRCARVQCVFENLHDSANGAACMRTMESFGLQYAHAIEGYEPFDVNTGIAMSADKWMSVERYKNCFDAAHKLRDDGFTLIATCLDEDSIPIEEIDFSSMKKIAILFGNEERGLSLGLRKQAHIKCSLPMHGFTQSYNLSVSCALFLYHLYHKGIITPDLTSEEATYFYRQWVVRSTKKARFLIDKHGFHDECDDF